MATWYNYQGRLTDPSGTPLAGPRSVQFTIYDQFTETPWWQETQTVTSDANGLFNELLGAVSPLPDIVFLGPTRYLGIKVGGDPELSPRTRLTSVPYAMRVSTIDEASDGLLTSNLRIGQSLVVTSAGVNASSATSYGGYFQSTWADDASHALHGEYLGPGQVDAVGVFGKSVPSYGWGFGGVFEGGFVGVMGNTNSQGGGIGVYGLASSSTGTNSGVEGVATGGLFDYGTRGAATSATGHGVQAALSTQLRNSSRRARH